MNISVMGCGRWGSFIAWYLERVSHQVTLYGRKGSKHLEQFRQTRSNGLLTLDEKVHLTDDLESAVNSAEVIVVSISAQSFRTFMKEMVRYDLTGKCFVLCMKGIEADNGNRKRIYGYAYSYLGWTRPCTGFYQRNPKLHGN